MYVKVTNGNAEIYSIGKLRKDNPNTSFPRKIPEDTLAAYDVYPYTTAEQPSYTARTQNLEQGDYSQVDGAWVLGWTVTDKTAEEITAYDDAAAAAVRSSRDSLLAETDYLALSDNTLSAEMAAYRQALRDITTHANFPNLEDADWPTKP
jgi:hypothetical protein